MIEILAAFALSVQSDFGAVLAGPRTAWQDCLMARVTEAAARPDAPSEIAEQALGRCSAEQGRYRETLMQITSNRRQRRMVDDMIEQMRGMSRESIVALVTDLRAMGAARTQ